MLKRVPRTNAALAAALALLTATAPAFAAINQTGPGEDGGGGTTEPPPPPPPPPPGYWEKVTAASDMIGTTHWGAGYLASIKVAATPGNTTQGTKDKLEGHASLAARAKLNGTTLQMFAVRAAGTTIAESRSDFNLTAYVGAAAVYSKDYASTTSTHTFLDESKSWNKTFVKKSATLWVGPVPVALSMRATGNLSAKLSGKISNVGLEAGAEGAGGANLYASAGTGFEYCLPGVGYPCVGASAGVYVDLKLIEATMPATAKIWWSLSRAGGALLNWQTTANLHLKSLNGELGLYAKAFLSGVFDEYWSTVLVRWNGFTAVVPIVNLAGNHCLVGSCTVLGPIGGIGGIGGFGL
jgi:hypothetical protein